MIRSQRKRRLRWQVSSARVAVACALAGLGCCLTDPGTHKADAAIAPMQSLTRTPFGTLVPVSFDAIQTVPPGLGALALRLRSPYGILPVDIRRDAAFDPAIIAALRAAAHGADLSSNSEELLDFGKVRLKRTLVTDVVRAARAAGIDAGLLMAVADKESTFATGARATTSTAVGLFQFIESTWLRAVRDFGAKYGLADEAALVDGPDGALTIADPTVLRRVLDQRRDPFLSAALAGELLRRDGEVLAQEVGRELSPGEKYLIHFLGPADCSKFMESLVARPSSTAARLLPGPARANRSIFYARVHRRLRGLSLVAVRDRFEGMMEPRLDRYRNAGAAIDAVADLRVIETH